MGKTVLAFGGGAPNFTLMAGALLCLHEHGLRPDVVSMAGGGSVLGLVYLAPKGMTREQALRNTVNFGVSDFIYAMLPINYKIFQKPGIRADRFRQRLAANPFISPWLNQYYMTNTQKLFSDWLQFIAAMMSPSDLGVQSTGLCAHAPFIENIVDFDRLKKLKIDAHINAYCIEDGRPRIFEKDEITVEHFRAGLSFPFFYPPFEIDGKHYFEGAAFQALNLKSVVEELIKTSKNEREADEYSNSSSDKKVRILVFDVLRAGLITNPRNMWEAYGQSIMLPLIALADRELGIFEAWIYHGVFVDTMPYLSGTSTKIDEHVRAQNVGRPNAGMYQVRLAVPEAHARAALTWAKSSLEYLFDLGYRRACRFISKLEEENRADREALFPRLSTDELARLKRLQI
jgi:NTE family protein